MNFAVPILGIVSLFTIMNRQSWIYLYGHCELCECIFQLPGSIHHIVFWKSSTSFILVWFLLSVPIVHQPSSFIDFTFLYSLTSCHPSNTLCVLYMASFQQLYGHHKELFSEIMQRIKIAVLNQDFSSLCICLEVYLHSS